MANHPSAAKRNRQRVLRTARNKAQRTALRSTVKKARVALESGDPAAAAPAVKLASKALAQASGKGLIAGNNAARVTSRLNGQLHKLSK